jgi:LPXTG-motif cell wall-anchored protein
VVGFQLTAADSGSLLGAGAVVLLAAGLVVSRRRRRRRPRSRPPATAAAAIRTESDQGPPPAIHIRFTGPDTTHAVRIEPRPGPRTTTIREVKS